MARQLSSEERESWLRETKRAWEWTSYYWHPLHASSRQDVLAFDSDLLESALPEPDLLQILAGLGAVTVLRHCEFENSSEESLDQLPFIYGAGETIITDTTLSWIIYHSHENTIAFGGHALIEGIQAAVPGWKQAQGGWGASDA